MGEPIAKAAAVKDTLVVPGTIARQLVLEARRCAPFEACGLLLESDAPERDSKATPRIASFCTMTNAAQRADRFACDPLEFVRREGQARASGLRVAGVYHSHPAGPAVPSSEDSRAAEALWGSGRSWIYLIVGLGPDGERACRAWRLVDARWHEVICREA